METELLDDVCFEEVKYNIKGGKKRRRAFLKEGVKNVQVVRDFPNRVCGFYPL
jgi:hypothetical protein